MCVLCEQDGDTLNCQLFPRVQYFPPQSTAARGSSHLALSYSNPPSVAANAQTHTSTIVFTEVNKKSLTLVKVSDEPLVQNIRVPGTFEGCKLPSTFLGGENEMLVHLVPVSSSKGSWFQFLCCNCAFSSRDCSSSRSYCFEMSLNRLFCVLIGWFLSSLIHFFSELIPSFFLHLYLSCILISLFSSPSSTLSHLFSQPHLYPFFHYHLSMIPHFLCLLCIHLISLTLPSSSHHSS